jgi:hypothetical protein
MAGTDGSAAQGEGGNQALGLKILVSAVQPCPPVFSAGDLAFEGVPISSGCPLQLKALLAGYSPFSLQNVH